MFSSSSSELDSDADAWKTSYLVTFFGKTGLGVERYGVSMNLSGIKLPGCCMLLQSQ